MQASETGFPIQRPLLFDFQNDRQARETDDVYLFGDALLVAPVLQPGQTARHVYLPEGTWIDWYTGERHTGGQFITAAAPLDRIPLFARGGHIIPSYVTAPQSTMGHQPEVVELHIVAPQEGGEFVSVLHEDDGLTNAFQSEACLRTTFRLSRRGDRIRVSAKVAGKGFPEFRRALVSFGLPRMLGRKIEVDRGEIRSRDGHPELENRGDSFELSFGI